MSSKEESYKAVGVLLDRGCKMVIITLGDEGCVFASSEDRKPVHVPAPTVTPVDTTVSQLILNLTSPFHILKHAFGNVSIKLKLIL